MPWTNQSEYTHAFHVDNVLDDGRVSCGSHERGVLVAGTTPDDLGGEYEVIGTSDGGSVVLPWARVVAWRAGCACGWAGTDRPAQQVLDSFGNATVDVAWSRENEDHFRPEWRAHADPQIALYGLRAMLAELYEFQRLIAEKVRTSRVAGATWADVGLEAQMTEEAAALHWG
jgi:hypothetical protein